MFLFFFTFLVFLFQTAYILGFYTVDCTCVMCTIAVSLRIPVSNVCVCVYIVEQDGGCKVIPFIVERSCFFHYDMIESTRN